MTSPARPGPALPRGACRSCPGLAGSCRNCGLRPVIASWRPCRRKKCCAKAAPGSRCAAVSVSMLRALRKPCWRPTTQATTSRPRRVRRSPWWRRSRPGSHPRLRRKPCRRSRGPGRQPPRPGLPRLRRPRPVLRRTVPANGGSTSRPTRRPMTRTGMRSSCALRDMRPRCSRRRSKGRPGFGSSSGAIPPRTPPAPWPASSRRAFPTRVCGLTKPDRQLLPRPESAPIPLPGTAWVQRLDARPRVFP